MNLRFLFFIAISTLIISCQSDEDLAPKQQKVYFKFSPKMDSLDFELNTDYDYSSGEVLNFEDFRMYVSNLILIDVDSQRLVIDSVRLLDISDMANWQFELDIPAKNYKRFSFGLGLSPDLNAQDPATFPAEHPLSTLHQMFWSWGSQYKFMNIEGKFSKTDTGVVDHAFSWHPGLDTLYTTVEFDLEPAYAQDFELNLELDLSGLIDSLDMETQTAWHGDLGSIDIPKTIIKNIKSNLELKQ
ncbi:MAG: MbnP family protein [Flavobacteriales bacterium]